MSEADRAITSELYRGVLALVTEALEDAPTETGGDFARVALLNAIATCILTQAAVATRMGDPYPAAHALAERTARELVEAVENNRHALSAA